MACLHDWMFSEYRMHKIYQQAVNALKPFNECILMIMFSWSILLISQNKINWCIFELFKQYFCCKRKSDDNNVKVISSNYANIFCLLLFRLATDSSQNFQLESLKYQERVPPLNFNMHKQRKLLWTNYSIKWVKHQFFHEG